MGNLTDCQEDAGHGAVLETMVEEKARHGQ